MNSTIGKAFAALLTLLSFVAFSEASAELQLATKLETYLKAAESVYGFSGAVAIAQDGKIIYAGGFDYADIQRGRKNSPTTRFSIGSITKQFTAVAILKLQEHGQLNVNDTISKYLPDFPENISEIVTIRHLLTHTSGIANYTAFPSFANMLRDNPSLDQQINMIASLPLEFEPGSKFSYSNSGYRLLEAIVEKVSGIPWNQYVADSVLAPAGMKASGYDLATVDLSLRAEGYRTKDGKKELVQLWPAGVAGAAGGLYSTVLDLVKWDEALRTGKVLKQASLDAMNTSFLGHYGFGVLVDSLEQYKRIWHDGLIDGFISLLMRFPDEKYCVAVLSNDDQTQAHKITVTMSSIALGLPYDLPVKKRSIAADTAKYGDYVGAYDLGGGQYRFITVERGNLYSQRSGGSQFEILPEATDKFYNSMENATTLLFKRDSAGKVIAHVSHQTGADTESPKMSDEEAAKVMPKYDIAKVDPKIYEDYAGEYQLAPEFILTVRRRGDQIFAQATAQQEFELFPSSETRFFYKVFKAEIEFVRDASGKVEKLVLFQNGQVMPAPKIK